MARSGLQTFIHKLRQNGQLLEIEAKIDPRLEVTEITDRISKQKNGGIAILFKNTGTSFPILINSLGSLNRIKIAFGGQDPDELAESMDKIAVGLMKSRPGLLNKMRLLPQLGRFSSWIPRKLNRKGSCQEHVMTVPDLGELPVLTCWPHDGGPFITLPLVHTMDPDSGSRNLGMYRMQVLDSKTTGMHWHMHKTGARHFRAYKKQGKRMPVAVALGGDPIYTYCATAPLPDGIDEYLLAGYIRKKPVKLVKCLTQEIWVPDDADIIVEGYVDTEEDLVLEGPFGDHTGFYSLADYYPRFHVTCITHKKQAVYPATIVGIPPQEDAWIAVATEKLFLPPIKMSMIPELADMHMPEPGVAHNLAVFSIHLEYPGQGKKVLNSIWGAGQMMFNKFAVVTGDDIDIRDYKDFARKACKRIDPAKDLLFAEGPLDVLDHAAQKFAIGGKLGFDATGSEKNPDLSSLEGILTQIASFRSIHPEIADVNTSLLKVDIPLVIISYRKQKQGHSRELAGELNFINEMENIPFWIFVDDSVSVNDIYQVVWIVGNHTDPSRDAWVSSNPDERGRAKLFIDATRKNKKYDRFTRDWPNPVLMDEDTINRVDSLWDSLDAGTIIQSPSRYYRTLEVEGDAVTKEPS